MNPSCIINDAPLDEIIHLGPVAEIDSRIQDIIWVLISLMPISEEGIFRINKVIT